MKKLSEKGMTLIEVIVAVTILVLVLTSFLGLLVSSAKSTQKSRAVVDYTFIAQKNIDSVFEIVSMEAKSNMNNLLTDTLGYTVTTGSAGEQVFMKEEADENGRVYVVRLTFTDYTTPIGQDQFKNLETKLSNVLIAVTPSGESRPTAILETVMEWGG